MADRVRVVIVDDHSIFRSGLRTDLDESVDVVGEAADVPSAIAVIRETVPDIVLLDVHLPGGGGDDASGGEAVIRGSAPTISKFLALSVSDAAADVVRVIRAGARGYITKGSSGVEVSSAVHAVAGGDAVFSPRLAGFVLDAFGAVSGETATANDELDRLSTREQEVMRASRPCAPRGGAGAAQAASQRPLGFVATVRPAATVSSSPMRAPRTMCAPAPTSVRTPTCALSPIAAP